MILIPIGCSVEARTDYSSYAEHIRINITFDIPFGTDISDMQYMIGNPCYLGRVSNPILGTPEQKLSPKKLPVKRLLNIEEVE